MKINIDNMLYEDMKWLSVQINKPVIDFIEIANKIDLRQEDWDKFWKTLREYKNKQEHSKEKIQCVVKGKDWNFTKEEFDFVEYFLGGHIEEVSNCCSASIINQDICSECREHCEVVYIFE